MILTSVDDRHVDFGSAIGRHKMNSARKIYEQLISFKETDSSGETPQHHLLRYCSEILGGVERLHIDFKEKQNSSNSQLDDSDKRNLAKAVSGFANSSGGVLIWGIQDSTMSPKPINQVAQFVQSLLDLAPHLTDPIVQDIDGEWITSDEQGGFGIIYVPESVLPPHRVILNNANVKNKYYIRSGSSFMVATHTQLEDMFGRRPKPSLSLSTRLVLYNRSSVRSFSVNVFVGIENKGRGSAKSPFLAVKVNPPYEVNRHGIDGNGGFGLEEIASSSDIEEKMYGASANTVIHPGTVRDVALVRVEVDRMTTQNSTPGLVIDYRIAAEGIQLIEAQTVIQGSELSAVLK